MLWSRPCGSDASIFVIIHLVRSQQARASNNFPIANLQFVFCPVIPGQVAIRRQCRGHLCLRWRSGLPEGDEWPEAVRIFSRSESLSTLGLGNCGYCYFIEDFLSSCRLYHCFLCIREGWYSGKEKSVVIFLNLGREDLNLLTHTQGLSKRGWFHV